MKSHVWVFFVSGLVAAPSASAAERTLSIPMHKVSAQGVESSIGTIELSDRGRGVTFTPTLSGLSAGEHGFHVHERPSCEPAEKNGKLSAAEAAGGHWDPNNTGKHEGPTGTGHAGDLPPLLVEADGTATKPLMVARVSLEQLRGRALIIHEGGDNFSDSPKPLGGGGARIACGVIPVS